MGDFVSENQAFLLKRRVVTGDNTAVLGTAFKGIDNHAKGDSTLQLTTISY